MFEGLQEAPYVASGLLMTSVAVVVNTATSGGRSSANASQCTLYTFPLPVTHCFLLFFTLKRREWDATLPRRNMPYNTHLYRERCAVLCCRLYLLH